MCKFVCIYASMVNYSVGGEGYASVMSEYPKDPAAICVRETMGVTILA